MAFFPKGRWRKRGWCSDQFPASLGRSPSSNNTNEPLTHPRTTVPLGFHGGLVVHLSGQACGSRVLTERMEWLLHFQMQSTKPVREETAFSAMSRRNVSHGARRGCGGQKCLSGTTLDTVQMKNLASENKPLPG